MQSKVFSINKTLNLGGRLLDLSTPKLMGILNTTPDSFYDGGKYSVLENALSQAEKMIEEGAHIIDVGGYSTRPGAQSISEEEELKRTIPVIEGILKKFPEVILSCDTFRSSVAEKALDAGVLMINDISGGELDDKMHDVVAQYNVPYIIMHMKGTPETMNTLTSYKDLHKEISDYFQSKIQKLQSLGVKDLLIDPGFGFAKTVEQNFELLKHLELLKIHGTPMVIGLSRKSTIWRTLETTPENALNGTTVLNTIALMKGASILRIHDVKEAAEAIKLTNFVR